MHHHFHTIFLLNYNNCKHMHADYSTRFTYLEQNANRKLGNEDTSCHEARELLKMIFRGGVEIGSQGKDLGWLVGLNWHCWCHEESRSILCTTLLASQLLLSEEEVDNTQTRVALEMAHLPTTNFCSKESKAGPTSKHFHNSVDSSSYSCCKNNTGTYPLDYIL